MRWFILVLSILWGAPAFANFSIIQVSGPGALPTPDVVCNVVTGVATGTGAGTCMSTPAVCDGSNDDSPAFATINTWAVGTWQASHTGTIGILVPSGKDCSFLSNTGVNWTQNIKSLFISGYGATFHSPNDGSAIMNFGVSGICEVGITFSGGCSARTASVSAGSMFVTLLDTSLCSRFTVGKYVNMTGYDLQGLWLAAFNYPPNLFYHEYVLIADKSTCGSDGKITFTAPLTNSYLSTWPLMSDGSSGSADQGGPATLYALGTQSSWDWDVEIYIAGLNLNQPANHIDSRIRKMTYRDVTVQGQFCVYASQTKDWLVINSSLTGCIIEMDKLVGTATIQNSTVFEIDFQSSMGTFNLVNGTVTNIIQGTPQRFVGSNSHIAALTLGPQCCGRTDEVICTTCRIDLLGTPKGPILSILGTWSMSGGVITIPNTSSAGSDGNQARWAVPGTNVMWQGPAQSELLFHIIAVTQDATNTYIQTDLAGGFPSFSGSAPTNVFVHPSPKFTCTACTGTDPQIASLTQAPAAAPLYSYQTYTYGGSIGATVQAPFDMWGNLSQVNMNVTAAYTGAGSLSFNLTQFNNWNLLNSSNTNVNWNSSGGGPAVNAKSVGNRQITRAGTTCPSGTCTGDSGMAAPDATTSWFTGIPGAGAVFSSNVSGSCPGAGCPSVTVTIQTDQGVVNP